MCPRALGPLDGEGIFRGYARRQQLLACRVFVTQDSIRGAFLSVSFKIKRNLEDLIDDSSRGHPG